MKADLVQLSDSVWSRTIQRLDGLTDEEYLWEPVRGCWSIRPAPDGTYRVDWAATGVSPPPFTNIAWRMCHLIACYGSARNGAWLRTAHGGSFENLDPAPTTAQAAVEALASAHDRWDTVLGSLSDAALSEKLGPVAGPFAESERAGFVLHMLDEFIHHGAEISLLRDLWRVRSDLIQ
jgi:hypothetical protein